ncbi:hypothetical protein [Ottowia sp.]|uniref:hypothetical protein n=1 Tax=Ottowia sp. TaxID=1898956 RepID=UPI0025F8EC03|nr:hypothetical protein [Ottowia sp.]
MLDQIFWWTGAVTWAGIAWCLLWLMAVVGWPLLKAVDIVVWRFRFGDRPIYTSGERVGQPISHWAYWRYAARELLRGPATFGSKDCRMQVDVAWVWQGPMNWRDYAGRRVWRGSRSRQ